jgi:hypothetical protein
MEISSTDYGHGGTPGSPVSCLLLYPSSTPYTQLTNKDTVKHNYNLSQKILFTTRHMFRP